MTFSEQLAQIAQAPPDEALSMLETRPSGLTEAEAQFAAAEAQSSGDE